ncbi:MAG: M23 family peptidase [Cytophagaceae bacterium]|nr:MAG: M23 family peptidase [Cytophagaceae bacterium]
MLKSWSDPSDRVSGFPSIRSSRTALSIAVLTLLVGCAAPTQTPQVPISPGTSAKTITPLPLAIFVRPAIGPIITPYDSNRSKGIDIAGHAGDPVVAAADGRVVYVGDQLRGYGQMVIIKHDETFLTAYAHNQIILVSENDAVLKNQKIAEMGQTDAERVKLHFEIRKNGVAVDPEPYLSGKLR